MSNVSWKSGSPASNAVSGITDAVRNVAIGNNTPDQEYAKVVEQFAEQGRAYAAVIACILINAYDKDAIAAKLREYPADEVQKELEDAIVIPLENFAKQYDDLSAQPTHDMRDRGQAAQAKKIAMTARRTSKILDDFVKNLMVQNAGPTAATPVQPDVSSVKLAPAPVKARPPSAQPKTAIPQPVVPKAPSPASNPKVPAPPLNSKQVPSDGFMQGLFADIQKVSNKAPKAPTAVPPAKPAPAPKKVAREVHPPAAPKSRKTDEVAGKPAPAPAHGGLKGVANAADDVAEVTEEQRSLEPDMAERVAKLIFDANYEIGKLQDMTSVSELFNEENAEKAKEEGVGLPMPQLSGNAADMPWSLALLKTAFRSAVETANHKDWPKRPKVMLGYLTECNERTNYMFTMLDYVMSNVYMKADEKAEAHAAKMCLKDVREMVICAASPLEKLDGQMKSDAETSGLKKEAAAGAVQAPSKDAARLDAALKRTSLTQKGAPSSAGSKVTAAEGNGEKEPEEVCDETPAEEAEQDVPVPEEEPVPPANEALPAGKPVQEEPAPAPGPNDEKIAALDKEIAELKDKKTEHGKTYETLDGELTALKKRRDALNKEITGLGSDEQACSEKKAELQRTKSDIDEKETKRAKIRTDLLGYNKEISKKEAELEKLRSPAPVLTPAPAPEQKPQIKPAAQPASANAQVNKRLQATAVLKSLGGEFEDTDILSAKDKELLDDIRAAEEKLSALASLLPAAGGDNPRINAMHKATIPTIRAIFVQKDGELTVGAAEKSMFVMANGLKKELDALVMARPNWDAPTQAAAAEARAKINELTEKLYSVWVLQFTLTSQLGSIPGLLNDILKRSKPVCALQASGAISGEFLDTLKKQITDAAKLNSKMLEQERVDTELSKKLESKQKIMDKVAEVQRTFATVEPLLDEALKSGAADADDEKGVEEAEAVNKFYSSIKTALTDTAGDLKIKVDYETSRLAEKEGRLFAVQQVYAPQEDQSTPEEIIAEVNDELLPAFLDSVTKLGALLPDEQADGGGRVTKAIAATREKIGVVSANLENGEAGKAHANLQAAQQTLTSSEEVLKNLVMEADVNSFNDEQYDDLTAALTNILGIEKKLDEALKKIKTEGNKSLEEFLDTIKKQRNRAGSPGHQSAADKSIRRPEASKEAGAPAAGPQPNFKEALIQRRREEIEKEKKALESKRSSGDAPVPLRKEEKVPPTPAKPEKPAEPEEAKPQADGKGLTSDEKKKRLEALTKLKKALDNK
jgi:hypothetical protein